MTVRTNFISGKLLQVRHALFAMVLCGVVACGGSTSDSGSGSGLRNGISEAEFSLVNPPSVSQLLAVLRFLTRLTSTIVRDPAALSRGLFDGVRDSVATGTPVVGDGLDQLFTRGIDRLSRASWSLILDDPLNGIVASEVFDNALNAALSNYSCASHSSHLGAKTEAFFQALWLLQIGQITGATFAQRFADRQADDLAGPAQAMLRSNARFGLTVLQRFTAPSQAEAINLLASSPFFLDASGAAVDNAHRFVSDEQSADGRYRGTTRHRLTGDTDQVEFHLNRCNQTVWGQLLLLDGDGSVAAEWRLRGTIDGAGRVTLDAIDALERFFQSGRELLCRDVTMDLTLTGDRLSGSWESSKLTCPFGGSITVDREVS